jgi:hypothetical protein
MRNTLCEQMFSASPPNSDIPRCGWHFAFVPTTDVDADPPIGSYGQQADQSVYAVWKFGRNVDRSNQLPAIAPL